MSTKKVAIVQSNYIPWKGYFDMIRGVDEFVFYDEVKYTWQDWRNRNQIKTPQGLKWLTIPVLVKGKFSQRIDEAEIASNNWNRKHWRSIEHAYAKASFFSDYREHFESLYLNLQETHLSQINYIFIQFICDILGIETRFHWSQNFSVFSGKTERLIGICKDLGATTYLSGPAAKAYLDIALFEESGIQVEWMDYSDYIEYPQLYPPFSHAVSILDLIFNTGPDALFFMKRLS